MDKAGSPRNRKAEHASSNDPAEAKHRYLRPVETDKSEQGSPDADQPVDAQTLKWIQEKAEQGHAISQAKLSDIYYKGNGVEPNKYKAFKWSLKAAKKGVVDSQYRVAFMFVNGIGVEKDNVEYISWLNCAAKNGHANAQYDLAEYYGYNKNDRNYLEMLHWYEQSAINGNVDAAVRLGDIYREGFKSLEPEPVKAIRWLRRAADLGDMYACEALGEMYANGEGVNQDSVEAIRWYGEFAERGGTSGLVRIAELYEQGKGVPQDYAKALLLLQQAADRDDTEALILIGGMYEQGKGISKNYDEAARFYKLAASHDYRARDALSQLEERIIAEKNTEKEEKINKLELFPEKLQNKEENIIIEQTLNKETILDNHLLKLTNELLAAAGYAEQFRPAIARVLVPLIEKGSDDPAMLEVKLAAVMTDAPVARSVVVPPPPDTAPELYRNRPRDLKTGRQEGVDKFIARAYAQWIIDDKLMIPREALRKLDPECDFAISRWHGNHKGEQFPIKIVKSESDITLTPEQIRVAQRIAQRAYRQRKAATQER